MSKFKFIDPDWELDNKLTKWTKSKGLTDGQIEDQLDRFKDHEFNPMRSCEDRCWRRWIRNAIDWGRVVPSVAREYRKPQELTDEERKSDASKAIAQMNEYRSR